jgi:cellulose synthase/poly-beta-1,6-N-acetylglucosamine synthase-like glycosyltransferase
MALGLLMSLLLWLAAAFTVTMTLAMQRRGKSSPDRNRAFSVVAVARNEYELLPRCLEALERLDYPPDRYEIVLVDDASEDDTFALMQSWCAQGPNRKCLRLDSKDPALPAKKPR